MNTIPPIIVNWFTSQDLKINGEDKVIDFSGVELWSISASKIPSFGFHGRNSTPANGYQVKMGKEKGSQAGQSQTQLRLEK
jgi:hypothetical protein